MAAPLGWGIVGTGAIARAFVADLAYTESGYPAAVGSRVLERADRFGQEFGVRARYGSYEDLVADPNVDAVYVASPHTMHFDHAMTALRAGKPVLVEKSFTVSGVEARQLVATARAKGLFLMEAMWTRFLPHMRRVCDLLTDDALGRIVAVTADLGNLAIEDPYSRIYARELGGGALLDCGVYPVSFASMVLGRPSTILALAEPASTGVDAHTSVLLGYDNGAHALLSCSSRARSPGRAAIIGTVQRIEIEPMFIFPSSFSFIDAEGGVIEFESEHAAGRGLFYEADEVARCLRAGLTESPVMPLDETIEIVETMEAVLAVASSAAGVHVPSAIDHDAGIPSASFPQLAKRRPDDN